MLRIDLFELVDGLFKGFVYFFYNIFETIVALVRNPLRGPMRLYRRHRQANVRQLGGPTFLFLSFFAFFAVHFTMRARLEFNEAGGETPVGEEVGSALTNTPSVDADWLWLILATSLAATVIVDSALRLALSLPGAGRARRGLILESVEYSLFWPILVMIILSLRWQTLFPLASALAGTPDDSTFGFLLLLLLSLVPAALLLTGGARRRWLGGSRRWIAPARVAALVVMATIVAAAATAGARIGYDIDKRRAETRVRAFDKDMLVLDLRCELNAPEPYIDAVVWNRGGEAMVLPHFSFTLYVGDSENDLDSDEALAKALQLGLAFTDPAGPTVLFQPGQAQRLRMAVQGYQADGQAETRNCGLLVERPLNDAADLESRRLRGFVTRGASQ